MQGARREEEIGASPGARPAFAPGASAPARPEFGGGAIPVLAPVVLALTVLSERRGVEIEAAEE
jgi:hypothetical protein